MKKLLKMIGIIALVAVIGFAIAACGGGGGGEGGKTEVNLGVPSLTIDTETKTASWTAVENANAANGYTIKIDSGETAVSGTSYSLVSLSAGTHNISVRTNGYETDTYIYKESAYCTEQSFTASGGGNNDLYMLEWGVWENTTYSYVSSAFDNFSLPLTPAGTNAGYLTGDDANTALEYIKDDSNPTDIDDHGETTDTFENLINYTKDGYGAPDALKTAMTEEIQKANLPVGGVFQPSGQNMVITFIVYKSGGGGGTGGGGTQPGSAKAITAFTFANPAATGAINETAKTINVSVPHGTSVTSLTPTITYTGASISPASGAAQNFTNPVNYTVTAEDGSTQTYTVTVTVGSASSKAITGFSFTSPAATGVIDEAAKTISVSVPAGTTVTSLTPTVTHTGVSYSPTTAQNFTNAVTYTVTAEDGSTQPYTVTVKILSYFITGSGTSFTAKRGSTSGTTVGTANQAIQDVIDAIKSDANGNACTIQFGNGTTALDIGTARITFSGDWGLITLKGKITGKGTGTESTSSEHYTVRTITINDTVSVNSTADIENTTGQAVYNNSTGTFNISGGTVSGYVRAVSNTTNGTINISGGTVQATGPMETFGSHAVSNPDTDTGGTINITGGTVKATDSGRAVQNAFGTVNISGGTISSNSYAAVMNRAAGKITISGTAKISSSSVSEGTICIDEWFGTVPDNSTILLEIKGGTITNTASGGKAVNHTVKGTINISSGTIEASGTGGYAIYNQSTGAIKISGGTIKATGSGGYAVYNNSTGTVTKTGGTVTGNKYPTNLW